MANVVLALVSLAILPERVAIHFGLGGAPNGWASREVNALIFIGVAVPVFLLLWYSPSLVLRLPPAIINLPHKEYWLRPENLSATKGMLQRLMAQFGTALFLFLLCVQALAMQASLSHPVRLNERVFIAVLVAFLAYTAFWCIGLFRAFLVPDR